MPQNFRTVGRDRRGGSGFRPPAGNVIRNFSMTGAVPGTPGTPPTNMNVIAAAALASQIVAVGVGYIDIRFSGTANATTFPSVEFETPSGAPALPGQVRREFVGLQIVGGSLANIATVNMLINEYDAGLVFLRNTSPGVAVNSVMTRWQANATYGASTAFATAGVFLTVNFTGLPIDVTLRIQNPVLVP